jgi:uncharacterized protein YjbJ (UPF0337 family)
MTADDAFFDRGELWDIRLDIDVVVDALSLTDLCPLMPTSICPCHSAALHWALSCSSAILASCSNHSDTLCYCICYVSWSTLEEPGSFPNEKGRNKKPEEQAKMSTKDRASNRTQDAKGRIKEATGSITGNRDLENEGKTDQAKAGMKNVGEDLKDAGHKVKDAVTR